MLPSGASAVRPLRPLRRESGQSVKQRQFCPLIRDGPIALRELYGGIDGPIGDCLGQYSAFLAPRVAGRDPLFSDPPRGPDQRKRLSVQEDRARQVRLSRWSALGSTWHLRGDLGRRGLTGGHREDGFHRRTPRRRRSAASWLWAFRTAVTSGRPRAPSPRSRRGPPRAVRASRRSTLAK
jgi:hypothetical protein